MKKLGSLICVIFLFGAIMIPTSAYASTGTHYGSDKNSFLSFSSFFSFSDKNDGQKDHYNAGSYKNYKDNDKQDNKSWLDCIGNVFGYGKENNNNHDYGQKNDKDHKNDHDKNDNYDHKNDYDNHDNDCDKDWWDCLRDWLCGGDKKGGHHDKDDDCDWGNDGGNESSADIWKKWYCNW